MENQLFYRTLELDSRAVDPDTREALLSFSSEAPVIRWFGSEILLHGKDNVDLRRLRAVGSVLYGHRPEEIKNILGSIKRAWIEDRRGLAKIAFDDDETGDLALKKAKSGSLKGVSFGYMIDKARQLAEHEEWTDPESNTTYRGPALIATRWTPYEISLTPIPADATVGVGREQTRSLAGITLEKTTTQTEERKEQLDMDKNEMLTLIRDEVKGMVAQIATDIRATIAEASKPKFMCSAEDFSDLYGRAAAVSPQAQAEMASMLAAGKSAAEMQRKLLEIATTKTDAKDASGTDPLADAGTGTQTGAKAPVYRKVADVPDDLFFQSIANPSAYAIN